MAELLDKLEGFFCSPKFTSAIGDFMSEKVDKLQFVPLDEEQPLSNHSAFQEYCKLIERQLEEFILAERLSVKDVCDACALAQNSESSMHIAAIDYLVASTEYESFMQLAFDHAMMRQYDPTSEMEAWDPEEGGEGQAGEAAAAGGL